ncbi:MAG: serine protease [Rhodospirillaceae bacterium]|nr:serine protease [Rhodospirillaceae bacterium]MBT4589662.1 serine protease [Rhodospirillaceae bacterium]MBT4940262.1 serine protease [Rhodospirillaceae bacterium]MBT5940991.1 serine protease [Rhodospirillaceae bacterium]MBT7268419.1 serine protease [Rhodospirillaceae bacterium]
MKAHPFRIFVLIAILAQLVLSAKPANALEKDILQAVVGIKASVPADARTARFLGTERQGSGVVIDNEGLVLTIGYLILEAEGVIITGPGGTQSSANIIAYDHESGFGLLRMRKPLKIKPLRLDDSNTATLQDNVLVASRSGPQPVIPARVVSRRVFTGGWEYLLEKAIFTVPPHSFHSGAALISKEGKLLGIGSLVVANAVAPTLHSPGNMFVPVNVIKPVLADLLEHGQRQSAAKPWIGASTIEMRERVFINRVSKDGPASKAGLGPGDLIAGVNGKTIRSQEDFYRTLWAGRKAGDVIKLNVLPRLNPRPMIKEFSIKSLSRQDWLKKKPTL